jgi:hypothetical protein
MSVRRICEKLVACGISSLIYLDNVSAPVSYNYSLLQRRNFPKEFVRLAASQITVRIAHQARFTNSIQGTNSQKEVQFVSSTSKRLLQLQEL